MFVFSNNKLVALMFENSSIHTEINVFLIRGFGKGGMENGATQALVNFQHTTTVKHNEV